MGHYTRHVWARGNEHIRVHRRHRSSNDILSIIGGIFGIVLLIGLILLIGKFFVPIILGLALIGITLVLFKNNLKGDLSLFLAIALFTLKLRHNT